MLRVSKKMLMLGITISMCLAGTNLFAQGLVGKYVNESTGETLTISQANVSDAILKVSMTSEENILTGEGKFRYFNGDDSTRTTFSFIAGTAGGNANYFESWSGNATSKDGFKVLSVLGVKAVIMKDGKQKLCSLGGPFIRQ